MIDSEYPRVRHLGLYFLVFLLPFSGNLLAQEGFKGFLKNKEGFKLEPFAQFQLWSVYSTNQQVFNTQTKVYDKVDDRLNFLLRRTRIGFRMQPYDNLKGTVIFSFDAIGRDVQSGIFGAGNNGAIPSVGIFDAFLEWRLKSKSEKMFVVAGFFRPQIGRESITAAWQVASMEKALTQNYLRQHLVGVGSGRSVGVNVGGLLMNQNQNLVLNYNIGMFNPAYSYNNGNSVGSQFSPLITGRAVLSIGTPEMKQYGIAYNNNFFNKRKGVSIALDYSSQGKSDLFKSSSSVGTDVLLNFGGLNFDAEIHETARRSERDNRSRIFAYRSTFGHIRAGYNLILGKKYFVEPIFMFARFRGAPDLEGQADALAVRSSSGTETTYDAGINWHLQERRLKLLLHYTWREGNPGAAGNGATVNDYFTQVNVGAIRRGNWLGLGLSAIF
ncbi:hypothetical protein [Haliscomenobacter sp.]|uniref:hypothetical protein n=1 Tax=Haliscomenobacter sp. TaxID=2717303 RepID=UPI003BAC11F4